MFDSNGYCNQTIEYCQTSMNGKCLLCEEGFVKMKNQCVSVSSLEGCEECNRKKYDICILSLITRYDELYNPLHRNFKIQQSILK